MFHFLSLHTRDWGIWNRIDIPDLSRRILVIVGPNNAGKTTIADAQLTLLGSEKLFGDRTIAFYVRDPSGGKRKRVALIMAHVTNYPGARNRRPFYEAGIKTDNATIATAIEIRDGQANRLFFIGPGRLDPKQIQNLYTQKSGRSDEGEWMGLRDWQKRVMGPAQAGPKQLDQLAVDAAQVNEIVNRRDHQLYDSISRRLFETETLANYEASLRNLDEAKTAAGQWVVTLRQQEADLKGLERQKDILGDWQTSDQRSADAEKTLAAAKYAEVIVARDAKERTLNRWSQELGTAKEARKAATQRLARIDEERSRIEKELGNAKGLRTGAEKRRTAADKNYKDAYEKKTRLESAEAEFATCTKTPVESAQTTYSAALQDHLDLARTVQDEQEKTTRAAERIAQLKAGTVPLPAEARATHDALTAAEIPFHPLGEFVELDLDEAPLLEAALGHFRFTITVDASNANKARKIAQKHGFPGPIYAGPTAARPATESKWYTKGAPEPLAQFLAETKLSSSQADTSFGSIVTPLPSASLLLVQKAIKKLLEIAQDELEALNRKLRPLEEKLAKRAEAVQRADEELRSAKRAVQLRAILEELVDAPTNLKAATHELEEARRDLQKIEDAATALGRELNALSDDGKAWEVKLSDADAAVGKATKEVGTATTELSEADRTLEDLGQAIETILRNKIKQEKGEFTTVKMAEREVKLAKEQRARLPPRPEPGVDKLYERQFGTVEKTRVSLKERENLRVTAEKQTSEKRTHYLMASNDLFRGYERRLKEMGELANMTILAECPVFTMETTDEEIRNAKIEVRIAYGKTSPKWHGDPSFSQGQKYLNSLILLLGLAETGQESFFIMDEPTQNLSPDRIQVLFAFMQNNKAQYFLAIPTNLDPATYKGVGHLVALTRPDEATGYAPAPAIIEV